MALVIGRIASKLPARISHDRLEREIVAAFGPGIGWACDWEDGFSAIKAIRYEYDSALNISQKALEALISAHAHAPDEKDDRQRSEEQDAPLSKAEIIQKLDELKRIVLESVKDSN